MKKWSALLTCCLALGLVGAGCGDDDDDGGGAQTRDEPAQTAEKPAGEAPMTVSVSMKDTLFVPMEVTVKAGGTVKWKNDDPFAHTVTKETGPGADFDSGTVNGGETYEQKFDKPGKVDYVCTIHPSQTGAVVVQ